MDSGSRNVEKKKKLNFFQKSHYTRESKQVDNFDKVDKLFISLKILQTLLLAYGRVITTY